VATRSPQIAAAIFFYFVSILEPGFTQCSIDSRASKRQLEAAKIPAGHAYVVMTQRAVVLCQRLLKPMQAAEIVSFEKETRLLVISKACKSTH